MCLRTILAYATFAGLAFTAAVGRSDEQHPDTLLGFLKQGMFVGVQSVERYAAVSIGVYSDEQFAIAKDARILPLDELRTKYAAVEKQIQQELRDFSRQRGGDTRRTETESADPMVMLFPNSRDRLGVVKHVGDDYVLIANDDSSGNVEVISKRYILRIRLISSGARLLIRDKPGRIVRNQK